MNNLPTCISELNQVMMMTTIAMLLLLLLLLLLVVVVVAVELVEQSLCLYRSSTSRDSS